MTWLFRSRAPLPVLLYLAAQEGRLVTDEAGGCALFERPTSAPRPSSRFSAARVLDEYWDPLMFGLPAVAAMATAIPTAYLAGRTAGLTVVVGVLLYVVGLMIAVVVRQVISLTSGRRRLVESAIGRLRQHQWAVTLLHAPAGADAAAALIGRGRRQVSSDRLAIIVLTGGITGVPPGARGAGGLHVKPLSPRHPVLIAFRGTDPPLQLPVGKGKFRGRDLAVVLGGSAMFVLLLAGAVARDEARVCGSDCAGLPARYGDALYWLLSRMIGGDPDGLGATSAGNRLIGLLMTIYGVFVLVAIIGRVVQQRMDEDVRSGQDAAEAFEEERHSRTPPPAIRQRGRIRRTTPRRSVAGRARSR